MKFFLYFAAWGLSISVSAVLIYLAVELGVGLGRGKGTRTSGSLPGKCTGTILVPAHNEALSIAETVTALRASAPDCRIVVVADNCSDDTAKLAMEAGAEAISRTDPSRKGKGFALAFGRDHLALSPPDAVIVIDADCRLSPGSAEILIACAVLSNEPVQGVNLLVNGLTNSPLASISNFAMLVKNLVRARGLSRIAGGALLFGTGMAFPWKLFEQLELATSDAVEDLQLGIALAKQGVSVRFEDRALVTSPAASVSDSKGQRSRWEHGFLQTAVRNAIPLVLSGFGRPSRHLLFIGAHMMVPPLAMLITLSLIAIFVLAIFGGVFGVIGPVALLSLCLGIALVALLTAWWREGRSVISAKSLLMVPFYVLWKIPIYIRFFTSRQIGWNRTHRDGEKP